MRVLSPLSVQSAVFKEGRLPAGPVSCPPVQRSAMVSVAPQDIVLCFTLSPGASVSAGAAFPRLWRSLFRNNPGLAGQLVAVQLLCGDDQAAAARARTFVASELPSPGQGRERPLVLTFSSRSVGRNLNDAFLWATAAERAKFWLLWDDAHLCARPFLRSARGALEASEGWEIWQLMLAADWTEALPTARKVEGDGVRFVLPRSRDALDDDFRDHSDPCAWPGFSLGPSVHRLSRMRMALRFELIPARPFSEHTFASWEELQRGFGEAWERAGAVNAELLPTPAIFEEQCAEEADTCDAMSPV